MRASEAGFSLIEALVAMTVLAVTAAGLLSAAEETIRTTSALEERVLLRWVAEDQLAAARAGQELPSEVSNWDRPFSIAVERGSSADPDLSRLTVTVASPGGAALTLEGYVLKGPNS